MKEPAVYRPLLRGTGTITISNLHHLSAFHMEDFDDYNPVIVLGGTLDFIESEYERESEAARIEREVFNSLERGNVVCLTGRIDSAFARVLGRIGTGYLAEDLQQLEVDLRVKRSEFLAFCKGFVAAEGHFSASDFDDIICENSRGQVVGFVKKVGS
jgi:hypothetical protein